MDVMDFLYMDEREMCRHFILTYAKARKAAGEEVFTKAEVDAGYQFVEQLRTDVTLLSLFLRGEVSFSLNDDGELTVTKIRQRTTLADRNRDAHYRETKPRQFGNLHERMRYAIELLAQHPDLEGSELANALYDLETEVSSHVPATPPYGRRPIPAVEAFPTRKAQS